MSLHLSNTAPFEEILQWWLSIINTVFDLIGQRFEPQTSHFRDKHVTAQPPMQFKYLCQYYNNTVMFYLASLKKCFI